MPDIFLSYNREDQATARRFAEAFQAEGLEVWWDTTLRAGEAYDRVTEKALGDAKAVVVLWSPRSVDSRWVRSEATQADRNGTLVPVTIEACKRPIMFELTQTADLTGWDGSTSNGEWLGFLVDVKRFVQAGRAASEQPSAPSPAAAAPIGRPQHLSICVLPFANMSGDPEQEYFADGISEDIITDLSKVSALTVISRNSAFTFKGKHVDLPQVARQLGVTHVLEGSVRKAGNRVRITAQLIDGASNGHVWADRWDRDLDDIFALQDEISQAIVAALKLNLLPEEKKAIEDRGTNSVEAYDLYLRARALVHQSGEANLGRAVELYHEALGLDPGFLQGWLGLTTAAGVGLANGTPIGGSDLLMEMKTAVGRVAEIAPARRLAFNARALEHLFHGDLLGAERLLQQAATVGPPERGDDFISQCDILLSDTVGRPKEALERVRNLVRNDPVSLSLSLFQQALLDVVGRPDEAQAEYLRSRDLAGDHEVLDFLAFLRMWKQAKPEDVAAQYRRALASSASGLGHPVFARLAGVLDSPAAAQTLVRAAIEDPAASNDVRSTMELMLMAAGFDDTDLALTAMRRTYVDMQYKVLRYLWMPVLAKTRQDPRFKDIVRDLGLHDYWRASGNWGDFVRPLGDDDFEVIG